MHPEDIKAAVRKSGTNLQSIATAMHVSSNAVSLVVHSHATSARIAQAISLATGIPVSKLWPGRYLKLEAEQLKKAA